MEKQKKKGGALRTILIIVAIIVVLIIVASAIGGGVDDSSQTEGGQAQQEENQRPYSVGQTAVADGISITLLSATEMNDMEYFVPAEGNVFLVLEFELENNSGEDYAISSLLSFEAYCDDYSVDQQIVTPEGKTTLDGDIADGKRMNGVIVYEVPSTYSNFEIKFTPGVIENESAEFVINK
ncbi:MAG: DUF4352 domain-containing protein [Oscillospiraceae bacterium]